MRAVICSLIRAIAPPSFRVRPMRPRALGYIACVDRAIVPFRELGKPRALVVIHVVMVVVSHVLRGLHSSSSLRAQARSGPPHRRCALRLAVIVALSALPPLRDRRELPVRPLFENRSQRGEFGVLRLDLLAQKFKTTLHNRAQASVSARADQIPNERLLLPGDRDLHLH